MTAPHNVITAIAALSFFMAAGPAYAYGSYSHAGEVIIKGSILLLAIVIKYALTWLWLKPAVYKIRKDFLFIATADLVLILSLYGLVSLGAFRRYDYVGPVLYFVFAFPLNLNLVLLKRGKQKLSQALSMKNVAITFFISVFTLVLIMGVLVLLFFVLQSRLFGRTIV